MLEGLKGEGYLLFPLKRQISGTGSPDLFFLPLSCGPGLSGKGLGFRSAAVCGPSRRLPKTRSMSHLMPANPLCMHRDCRFCTMSYRVTELKVEQTLKVSWHQNPSSPRGWCRLPLDLPKRRVPELPKVLSHTRRPLPCDSLLLVPVPPATTFLSALMLSQGGCCPTSLRLPHPGAALGAWTGVGLSSSSTAGWVAS